MKQFIWVSLLLSSLQLAGCQGQVEQTATVEQPADTTAAIVPSSAPADALAGIRLRQRALPDVGVALCFPATWRVEPRQEKAGRVWVSAMACPTSVPFCANYVVNAVPLQTGASLDTYSSYYLTYLEKKYPVYKLIKVSRALVNGLNGRVIDYIYQENNHNLGGTVALLQVADSVVVLNFAALNEPEGEYVRYRGLFERVISSVKAL